MSSKDLNLSMDRNFIQPQASRDRPVPASPAQDKSPDPVAPSANAPVASPSPESTPVESTSVESSPIESASPGRTTATLPQHTNTSQAPRQYRAILLAIATISVANLVLLIGAGFWLYEQGLNPTASSQPGPNIEQPLQAQMESTGEQLQALQQKFDQLELHFTEQQQLLAASHHIVTDKIETLLKEQRANYAKAIAAPTAPPASQKPEPKKAAPSNNWYVNLGTFSHRAAAQKLQQQIKALGYSSIITTVQLNNKTAHRVQLPGFASRELAEASAQKIMQQTELNGLWAWKDN